MSATTASDVVAFLGLSAVADAAGDAPRFPLGLLYPYSRDLQRVCKTYDDMCATYPDGPSILHGSIGVPLLPEAQAKSVMVFLASIATLHSRIAFAPGPAGDAVGAAYRLASRAVGAAP